MFITNYKYAFNFLCMFFCLSAAQNAPPRREACGAFYAADKQKHVQKKTSILSQLFASTLGVEGLNCPQWLTDATCSWGSRKYWLALGLLGFALWKTILPEKAFFGAGRPSVIMTDDSDAERAALTANFPTSCLLLCQFHVLQVSEII